MKELFRKGFKYKKIVIMMLSVASMCVCINYIGTWEHHMKQGCRFIKQFDRTNQTAIGINIIKDSRSFPVTENNEVSGDREIYYYYENGYGDGRSFGGKRTHEGIDIMSSHDEAALFKIRSVSDGVVEKIGWLKLGGYRIGIRSDRGIYYYYAHLASYAPNIKCGDRVKAGEIIGYMGNTGYGAEGTTGKFPVHLHFGIYIKDGESEKSINPFYLLKMLEDKSR